MSFKNSASNDDKPIVLSPTLSSFFNNIQEFLRSQVVKQIWGYIKNKIIYWMPQINVVLYVMINQMSKIISKHFTTK